MIINHNLSSLNTYRNLSSNNLASSKALEKLSSGLRINKAGDDAAGLAISEKMRGQIRGFSQASRNAQDGISMIQTAEGGLSSIHNILQRSRELAVQASNGTLTENDRTAVNDEWTQLKTEIDRVANNTEFNTAKLLNEGSLSGISQTVIEDLKAKVPLWVDDALSAIQTELGIAFPSNIDLTVKLYQNEGESSAAYMATSDGGATLELGLNLSNLLDASNQIAAGESGGQFDTVIAHEIVHALQYTEMSSILGGGIANDEMWFVEGLATTLQGGNGFLSGMAQRSDASVSTGAWNGDYGSAFAAVRVLHEVTNGGIQSFIDQMETGITLDQAFAMTMQEDAGGLTGTSNFATATDFINWFNTSTSVNSYLNDNAQFATGTGAIRSGQGNIYTGNQAGTIANDQTADNSGVFNITFDTSVEAKNFKIQLGANVGQSIDIQSFDATVSGLGLMNVSLAAQETAQTAIDALDSSIQKVSGFRSYYGSVQNRLEHTSSNLNNSEENLTAAESRIRDVDMAKEMMNFQKNDILSQAAQAMLAQANQQPQGVLQLLR